jgi:hypothetical protein
MFGVGCSFADNDQERQYRNYIMDQAARGYFTTGEITGRDTITTGSCPMLTYTATKATAIPLCTDDLFDVSTSSSSSSNPKATRATTSSLVSHLIPPHRRTSLHQHPSTTRMKK